MGFPDMARRMGGSGIARVAVAIGLLVLGCAWLLSMLAGRDGADSAVVYPEKNWATAPLEELGLARAPLEQLAAEVGGDGHITRYGLEAYSWGNPRRKRNFGSASKVFFSYLLFHAERQGRLQSVDAPVQAHVPELAALKPGSPPFTWRQMANLTACYGVQEAPGTAFAYSDYQVMLLADALVERVYGAADWSAVFGPEIAAPLGMQDKWDALPFREGFGKGWRPMLSVRDMNRFGLLFLRDGQWEGQALLAPETARFLISQPHPLDLPDTAGHPTEMLPEAPSFGGGHHEEHHEGAFSYFWWVNQERPGLGRLWPSLPADAYAAVGYGGRCLLLVLPSQELTISWVTDSVPQTRHSGEGKLWLDARLRHLMAALDPDASARANITK